jgi:hypothetical protein
VIVGHSERRDAHREEDAHVRAKAEAAIRSGLKAIVCVGESLEEREAGRAVATVSAQVDASLPRMALEPDALAVAYEPIWAIGTGRVASCGDIEEMHAAIRERLVAAYGKAGASVRRGQPEVRGHLPFSTAFCRNSVPRLFAARYWLDSCRPSISASSATSSASRRACASIAAIARRHGR